MDEELKKQIIIGIVTGVVSGLLLIALGVLFKGLYKFLENRFKWFDSTYVNIKNTFIVLGHIYILLIPSFILLKLNIPVLGGINKEILISLVFIYICIISIYSIIWIISRSKRVYDAVQTLKLTKKELSRIAEIDSLEDKIKHYEKKWSIAQKELAYKDITIEEFKEYKEYFQKRNRLLDEFENGDSVFLTNDPTKRIWYIDDKHLDDVGQIKLEASSLDPYDNKVECKTLSVNLISLDHRPKIITDEYTEVQDLQCALKIARESLSWCVQVEMPSKINKAIENERNKILKERFGSFTPKK